jgi:6-pyruvoyltetrahydropterin/6-carboxytetrahydropterin synthase
MDHNAYLTLRVEVSALHELKNPNLSDAENKKIFGKCFRTHGHNYYLEATVKGAIDVESGLCCNRDLFQDILNTQIVRKFNGQDLNNFFKSTTGENLAREFFEILSPKLKPMNLVWVRLQETPKNFFSYGMDLEKNPLKHY